jgi:GT2 family glycosyltransferase
MNTGFAKGNNIAITEALKDQEIEYIICLNNDTIVNKNWLSELIKQVNQKNNIDIVSSKALLPDGKIHTIGLKFEKNLMGNGEGGLSIGYLEDSSKFNTIQEVFAPIGLSCLFTRRLLEDIGLFDEDFFAYCEDYDLGFRARNKGYKCIFTPFSILTHYHSQTGGKSSPFKAYLVKRNSYYVAIKNFSLYELFLYPIREIYWNFQKVLNNKKNNLSLNQLQDKIGFVGLVLLMLKVYLSVILNFPKMFIKRFKKQHY